jgi:hypothetical protein
MQAKHDNTPQLVWGPHPELAELIGELQDALVIEPRKRRAAIEKAIAYLERLYRELDSMASEMPVG